MENIEAKILETIYPQIDPPQGEHYIVYGVGNAECYQALKGWLKKKRERLLVLIEDDLSVLKGLLDSALGSEILRQKRVQLHFFEKGGGNENLYQRLMWQGFNRTTEVIRDPRYEIGSYSAFKDAFLYDEDRMKWFGRELACFGVGYYANFYKNLKQIPASYAGVELFGKAQGVPAFIVGAGPSLNKNGELLKQVKKKGLIFAGGASSLPALEHMGVIPDFAVGIDPNTTQYERLIQCQNTQFPYFYRLRVNSQALNSIEGPKLFLPGSGLYQTAAWIGERLGLQIIDIDEGHNVIHFVTDIAVKMGCNPIVFIGMDLAYTESKAYALGVPWPIPPPQDVVPALDIEGKQTLTRWVWLKESSWMSEYAKEHPEVQFLNATEGGIGFKAIVNQPLTELLPKEERVPKDLFCFDPLPIRWEQIEELVRELKESLIRIDQLLTKMEVFYKQVDPAGFTGTFPEEALWSLQLQEEPAFGAILSVFDEFYLQLMGNSTLFYLIQRDGMNKELAKKILKAHGLRIQYLKKVIALQLELIKDIS